MLYVIAAASAVTVALLLVVLAARNANATKVRALLVLSGVAAFVTGFAALVAFASN